MNIINLVNRYKYIVIFLLIVFIVLGALSSLKLNLDPSLDSRFLKNNPQIAAYENFRKEFGPEPLLAVVWEMKNPVWGPEEIEKIGELGRRIRKIEGVESIISIADIPGIKTDEILSHIEIARALPIFRKLLSDKTGRRAVIIISTGSGTITPSAGKELFNKIEKLLSINIPANEHAFVTGPLAMQSKAIEYSRSDLLAAVIIVGIATLLIFLLIYRSVRGLAAAAIVSSMAIAGACGIISALNIRLSQFALIAIPILAAISLQDVIHMVEQYTQGKNRGKRPIDACRYMLSNCLVPCIWTTITTAAAFATLLISDIEQIRSIGLLVALGSPIALISSFLAVPAMMLTSKDVASPENIAKHKVSGFFARHILEKNRLWAAGLLIIVLLSSYGLRFAKISLDFPRIFRPDVPFQKEIEDVDKNISGAASFEIILKTNDGTNFTDPEKFRILRNLQSALRLTSVNITVSPVDLGLSAYLLKNDLPKDAKDIFKDPEGLVKKISSEEKDLLKNWVTEDFQTVRIHARISTDRQSQYSYLVKALTNLKAGFAKAGVEMSWTGFSMLYKEMEKRMLFELITSFLLAILFVLILLTILFRSFKWGLLAMIPNIAPLLITVGMIGYSGTGFSLGLIILPAVGIGLIVDDTIHMIWSLRHLTRSGMPLKDALERIFSGTGRALILTTVIVSAGFASLATSRFITNVQLAYFMPLLLILALIFDLIWVPAILSLADDRKKIKR